MKKSMLTAGLLSLGGCAMAQSSVTVFGVLDTTWQRADQAGVNATRLLGVGGNQFSRIGFRGVEDLGSGLSAGFVLDAGVSVDTGAGGATSSDNQTTVAVGGILFNRRSTVSLMSPTWGEVRLGRDFVPTYWNLTVFDPFGTAGAGSVNNLAQGSLTRSSTVLTAVRASNSIGYFLPVMGGFYGQAMYALGENSSNAAGGKADDGNYAAVRLGYAFGSMNFAVSSGKTTLESGDVSTTNVGASYEFGMVKLMAQYFRDSKEKIVAPSSSHGWQLGAQINVGSGYIPVSYTTVEDNSVAGRSAGQIAAGYVHNLSKRTASYTTLSQIKNENGAALTGGGVPGVANASWRGFDIGVRHSF